MPKPIFHILNNRTKYIDEIKDISAELISLTKKVKAIETEYFDGKINFMTLNSKLANLFNYDWAKELSRDLDKYVNDLLIIDHKLTLFVSDNNNLLSLYERKKVENPFKNISNYFHKKIQEFKEYERDPLGYLKAIRNVFFHTSNSDVNERILAMYNELLKAHIEKTKTEKSIGVESIDLSELDFSSETELSKEQFRHLSLFKKIKYWYKKKFVFNDLIKNMHDKNKGKTVSKSKLSSTLSKLVFGKPRANNFKSLIQLRRLSDKSRKKRKEARPYSLDEEINSLNKIFKKEREKKEDMIYTPSFFGVLSNMFFKDIGVWLINQMPDLFKNLYRKLQIANIKLLSSTYINLMVFASFVVGVILFILGMFLGIAFLHMPVPISLGVGWLLALLGMLMTAIGFFAYPNSKISMRKRSIETNLPFAIIHMSAIAGSGLTPLRMFELIAESDDFGAVSEEFRRIVKYVNLFGTDLITAIKSTIDLNPDPKMQDFLNGLITSIESGGDLVLYLTVKANEILDMYRIERDKANENISVFSEIYLGVVVTAPLFFVLVISIVGFVGGSLGGLSAPFLLGSLTYVVLPLMNLVFYAVLDNIMVGF